MNTTVKKDAQFIIDICIGLVEFIDQKNIVTIIEPLENWTGQTKIIKDIVFLIKTITRWNMMTILTLTTVERL